MIVLDEATVAQHMPSPATAIDAMDEALRAIATGAASVTPKNQVTFPSGFANAMPAAWPAKNLLGMKWVKIAASIEANILLDDPHSGHTTAMIAGTGVTGLRTAAVTGASLRRLEPDAHRAVFMGTGVQARSHAQIFETLGYHTMFVWGRRPAAVSELQQWAATHTPDLTITPIDHDEIYSHKIIVSGLAFGASGYELDLARLRPDASLLPIDYATVVGSDIAKQCALFADDPEQFNSLLSYKFPAGYPQAHQATGDFFDAPRPQGRVLVQNLGSGLGDVVFADLIVRSWKNAQESSTD
ncbi:MAG: ornithine cyclodeaminase [Corynebacterium sp.]|nr:ornithine cyclodeaminase [Corynebacterium sp.]